MTAGFFIACVKLSLLCSNIKKLSVFFTSHETCVRTEEMEGVDMRMGTSA
jgi:hypothetical protein